MSWEITPKTTVQIMGSTSLQGVTYLASGGTKVIGYVWTDFGKRDIDAVKNDIKKYSVDFNSGSHPLLVGIYFDEVSTSMDPLTLNYYKALHHFVRNSVDILALDLIVFNHGASPPEIYLDWADINIIFEGSYKGWLKYIPDSYLSIYDPEHFAALVYGVEGIKEMSNAIELAMLKNIGISFVTDDSYQNPWDELPSYWDDQVRYMAL